MANSDKTNSFRLGWMKPAALMVSGLCIGCSQPQGTPASTIAGPMDPNSVTMFTLAVAPDSVSGCILADSSMTRPMTLTVTNDSAELLTSGGIHYPLTRVSPNVYAGGYYVKIRADLAARPKRLNVSTQNGTCKWAATAA
ncbi:MAG TPA: hypothetical protein VGM96_17185 [Reyranella sp.]|jgi:hypothetical protein